MVMKVYITSDTHHTNIDELDHNMFYGADAIIHCGDVSDRSFGDYIDRLMTVAPTYYVLGNHDYWNGHSMFMTRMEAKQHGHYLYDKPYQLNQYTTIVGVDGWYDLPFDEAGFNYGTVGDFLYINELKSCSPRVVTNLAREYAYRLHLQLQEVDTDNIIIVTHVNPFPAMCKSPDAFSNVFYSAVLGDAISEYANQNQDKNITVFCGHTHKAMNAKIGNVNVYSLANREIQVSVW